MSPLLLRIILTLTCLREAFTLSLFESDLLLEEKIFLFELLVYFQPCDSCFSGPPISPLETWSVLTDPCRDWYGIGCTKMGENMTVTSLKFPPYFTYDGQLPTEIQYLSNLNEVDFSVSNGYEACQYFKSFPGWLENLPKLEVIDVSGNTISYIPEYIYVPSLTKLYLNSNMMDDYSYMPSTTSIQILDISQNLFTQFPPFIQDQSNLTFLNASLTNIRIFPDWFSKLPLLEVLDIRNCSFNGSIPDVLKNIPEVYLGGSGFEGSYNSCIILRNGTCVSGNYKYKERVPYYDYVQSCGNTRPPSWSIPPAEPSTSWDYSPEDSSRSPTSSKRKKKLSAGEIVGIILGVLFVILGAVFWCKSCARDSAIPSSNGPKEIELKAAQEKIQAEFEKIVVASVIQMEHESRLNAAGEEIQTEVNK